MGGRAPDPRGPASLPRPSLLKTGPAVEQWLHPTVHFIYF